MRRHLTFTTRRATLADATHVQRHLRRADAIEIAALGLGKVPEVIRSSFDRSLWCEVACLGPAPAAIYGLSPGAHDQLGYPWLLGTQRADTFGVAFVRVCRPVVSRMLEHRPALVNFVHVRNLTAHRWLRWLGFQLVDPITIPATGERFFPFWAAQGDAHAVASRYIDRVRFALLPQPVRSSTLTH